MPNDEQNRMNDYDVDIVYKLQQNHAKHRHTYEKTIEKYAQCEDDTDEVDWSDVEDEDGEEVENQIDLAASFNEEIFANLDYAEKIVNELCNDVKKNLTSTPIHNEIIATSTPITNEPVAIQQLSHEKDAPNMPQITPIKGIVYSNSNCKKPNGSNRDMATKRNILDLVREKNMMNNIKKKQNDKPNEKQTEDDVIVLSDDDDDENLNLNTSNIDSRFNFQNLIRQQLNKPKLKENKTVLINDSDSTIPFAISSIMTGTRFVPNTQPELNAQNIYDNTINSMLCIPETQMLTKIVPDTQQQLNVSCQIADSTNMRLELSKDNKRSNKDRSKNNDSDLSNDANSKKFKYCDTIVVIDESNVNTQSVSKEAVSSANHAANLNDSMMSIKAVDVSIMNSTPCKQTNCKQQNTKLQRFESFIDQRTSESHSVDHIQSLLNLIQNQNEKNTVQNVNNNNKSFNQLKIISNLIHNGQNKKKLNRNLESQQTTTTLSKKFNSPNSKFDKNESMSSSIHLTPKQKQDSKHMSEVVRKANENLKPECNVDKLKNKNTNSLSKEKDKTTKQPKQLDKSLSEKNLVIDLSACESDETFNKSNKSTRADQKSELVVHCNKNKLVIQNGKTTNKIANNTSVNQSNKSNNSTPIKKAIGYDLYDADIQEKDETICEQLEDKNKAKIQSKKEDNNKNQTKKDNKVSFMENELYDDGNEDIATPNTKKILNSTTNQSNRNHSKLVEMIGNEQTESIKKNIVNQSIIKNKTIKNNQLQHSFKFTSFVDNDDCASDKKTAASDSNILFNEDILLVSHNGPLNSTPSSTLSSKTIITPFNKSDSTPTMTNSSKNKKEIVVIKKSKLRKSESDCQMNRETLSLMPPPPPPPLNVSSIETKQKRKSSSSEQKGVFYCGKFIPVVEKENTSLNEKSQITIKLNNSSVNKSSELADCSSNSGEHSSSSRRKSDRFNLQKFLSESFKKSQEKN